MNDFNTEPSDLQPDTGRWEDDRDWSIPPWIEEFARVGVRSHRETKELLLLHKDTRELVILNLASPSQMAAAVARHIGSSGLTGHRLADHMRDLAKGAANLDGVTRLGPGMHIIHPEGAVYITGSRAITWTPGGGFVEWSSPLLMGKFMAVVGGGDWLKTSVEDLNKPLVYGVEEAGRILFDIVSPAWGFEDNTDVWVHQVMPFYLAIHTIFGLKASVDIPAPSASGKSELVQGYYAGADFPGIGGPFAPGVVSMTDASEAAVNSLLADSAQVLVIDEAEPEDNPHLKNLIRSQRASSGGGTRKARGTPEGQVRLETRNIPMIMAGTQGATIEEADARRWIVTPLQRQEGRASPESVVREYLSANAIDTDELRRTIWTGLLTKIGDIKATYARLRENPPPGMPALDHRKRNVIFQLAAVMGALGYGVDDFAVQVATVQARRFDETIGLLQAPALLQTLLHGPFEFIDGFTEHRNPRRVRASLADLSTRLAAGEQHTVTEAGSVIGRDLLEGKLYLYVNWPAAIKGPLQGTRFTYMSPKRLVEMAKTLPEYRGQRKINLNDTQTRCSYFQLE